ncbi:hypothetical protein DSO57_1012032 [Entomophthora muscae]|uniref:Uncharacterized protein n=1 Tax=Entomophthora muscae TaxID=34485 RepID=A0ACC2RKU5_9FUNG|nr:hypothetical protein DSO57_1012032 [Entomophthora muscae]
MLSASPAHRLSKGKVPTGTVKFRATGSSNPTPFMTQPLGLIWGQRVPWYSASAYHHEGQSPQASSRASTQGQVTCL